jgi:gliding motility-associated-like protein
MAFGLCVSAQAGQFLGGELTYRLLYSSSTNYEYEITFRIYRDCRSEADLDDPVIRILNTTDVTHNTHPLFYREETMTGRQVIPMSYMTTPYCVVNEPQDCYEMIIFKKQIVVPYSAEGYTFYYTGCCRSGLGNIQSESWNFGVEMVNNIPEPGQALTFFCQVPSHDTVAQNSSPVSLSDSIIYSCVNRDFAYQFKFSDADGDSLAYHLVSSTAKTPTATTNLQPLFFIQGYSTDQPMGGQPPIRLDPRTCMLNGTPDREGMFPIVIAIDQYRNGILINTQRKEFQVNVRDCSIKPPRAVTNCHDSIAQFMHRNNASNTYDWDFGVTTINTDVSTDLYPVYRYPVTGQFEVKMIVTNDRGCRDSATTIAKIFPGLKADFDWSGSVCESNPLQFNDRTVTPFGNIQKWTWRNLNNNSVIATTSSFVYTPQVSGTMPYPLAVRLTVRSDLGCADSVLKDVLIYEKVVADAGPDRILAFGQTYTIPLSSKGATVFAWEPAEGLNSPSVERPVVTANRDITYTVKAGNGAGCYDIDTVTFHYMKGPDIYVPTAFTPDNDGLNDVIRFFPVAMQSASFSIYNRWGTKVFSTTDINRGWDGTLDGKLLDSGVYVWIVNAINLQGEKITKSGTITLIR